MTPALQQAHKWAFALRCDEAAGLIRQEQKLNPRNLAVAHTHGWNLFLELFTRENPSQYKKQQYLQDSLIDWVEGINAVSQEKYLVLSELYLLRAVLGTKFGDKWKPALDALSAHKNLQKMQKLGGKLPEGWGIAGAFELALASLPDNYKLIASMLGLKGNVAAGKSLLHNYYSFATSTKGAYLHQKAAILSVYAQHYFEYPSVVSFAKLKVPLQNEPLLTYLEATIFMEQSNGKAALEVLQQLQLHPKTTDFHHLDFMKGKALLSQLDEKCIHHFNQFLNQSDGGFYKHAVYRYLAWAALIWPDRFKSKEAAYGSYKSKAMALPKPITGVDKQAMRDFATQPFLPLLRARLLFDGGQYQNALVTLQEMEAATIQAQHNPYWYRMGRVLQKMNETTPALQAFDKMLPVSSDFEYANGLLQQCLILEASGQNTAALQKVNQLLALKDYPNIEGLQTRAKAAQQRLQAP